MSSNLFPTPCILCGGATAEKFDALDYRRPSDRTLYRVRWCHRCGLGRIAAAFSREDINKFFDVPYYTHAERADLFEGPKNQRAISLFERALTYLAWRVDEGKDFAPDEVGPANGRTFCDLGCGNGGNLKLFRDAGFSVVGVEPDPLARLAANEIAIVHDGTVEVLPKQISSKRFDVVLLSHVLDVCTDIKIAVSNVRSILNPAGTVTIEVPNCASKGFQMYGAEWPCTDVPRQVNFFTEKSLRLVIEDGGLAVKSVRYLGYTRQFSPCFWKTTRAEVRDEKYDRLRSCLWLAQTAFLSRTEKYDSIRVSAVAK